MGGGVSGAKATWSAPNAAIVSAVHTPETSLASPPGPRPFHPPDTRLSEYPDQGCSCLTSVRLLPESPRRSGSIDNATSPNPLHQTPLSDVDGPALHLLLSLVKAFFQHVYPLPSYSFLHPATTKERCRIGRLEPCLALAIAGTVTWLASTRTSVTDINAGERNASGSVSCHCHGSTSIEAAEHIIWCNLEKPTIPRLQALLLSISHHMQVGRFQRAFMLAAVASRFAAAMRLNHERQDGSSFVARETRRRILWSLKMLERYFSVGLPEFELCPFEAIYLQLPCREDEFDVGHHGNQLPETSDLGAYSLCVSFENIRRDIMKLTRGIILCDSPLPQLPSLVRCLELTLSEVRPRMPHGPELSFSQINDLLRSPWLPRHIAMQLSWHQCNCDVYRLFLPGYQEAAPQPVLTAILDQKGDEDQEETLAGKAERLCFHHASAIITILTTLNQQSTRPLLLEFDVAICGYHAMRLILFLSQFGRSLEARPTAEFAASRAELCLAAIRRFFPGSKLVDPMISEIEQSIRALAPSSSASASTSKSTPAIVTGTSDFRSEVTTRSPWSERDVVESSKGSEKNLASQSLSSTAKIGQRLAIHSLLRQAEFADTDEPDYPD